MPAVRACRVYISGHPRSRTKIFELYRGKVAVDREDVGFAKPADVSKGLTGGEIEVGSSYLERGGAGSGPS